MDVGNFGRAFAPASTRFFEIQGDVAHSGAAGDSAAQSTMAWLSAPPLMTMPTTSAGQWAGRAPGPTPPQPAVAGTRLEELGVVVEGDARGEKHEKHLIHVEKQLHVEGKEKQRAGRARADPPWQSTKDWASSSWISRSRSTLVKHLQVEVEEKHAVASSCCS